MDLKVRRKTTALELPVSSLKIAGGVYKDIKYWFNTLALYVYAGESL
jgi:hypothetical protein